MEKKIALVFGILALALEVYLSIVNPTIESITASAFALIIVVCSIISLCKRITITEDEPRGKRKIDAVLQLSDEIAPYVKHENGKVSITLEG